MAWKAHPLAQMALSGLCSQAGERDPNRHGNDNAETKSTEGIGECFGFPLREEAAVRVCARATSIPTNEEDIAITRGVVRPRRRQQP